MALNRDFKDTVKTRALRDYINATVGFEELAVPTEKSPKSLMRIFSHEGNPRADNIFSVISTLGQKEGIELHVHTVR